MRIMEGQGVDGHVGDTSPKRNAFARVCENVFFFSLLFSLLSLSGPPDPPPDPSISCLVLSCLVLSCLCVCWCARVLACKTLPAVSLRRAGVQQLYQVQRMIGGLGNVLFSTCSQTLNVLDTRVSLVNLRSQVRSLRGLFLVSRKLAIRDRPNIRLR